MSSARHPAGPAGRTGFKPVPPPDNVCVILDLASSASDLMAFGETPCSADPLPAAAGGSLQARPSAAAAALEAEAEGMPLLERLAHSLRRLSRRWKSAVVATEDTGRAASRFHGATILKLSGQLRERIGAACKHLNVDTAIVCGFDSPLVTSRACEELLVEHRAYSASLTVPTCYPLGTAPVVVEAAALLAPGHLVPRCAWSFALDRSRLFGSCLKATYDSPLGRELLRALSAVSPTPTRIARFVIENPRHFLDAALERMPADVTPDLERARKRRTRRNLAVVGYFGYGNLGDEMILGGMLTAMRSSGFDGNVIVISGDPQDTLNRHGVEAVPSSDSAQVLKALAASDLLVIGGGGLLHDAGGLDFGDALERFLEGSPGLVQLSALAMLARALDMRVAIVGVGIGPLFRELAVDLAHQLLRLSGAVSVRDRGSLEWCGLWDDVSGKARLSADLAFLLDAQPAQEPHGPAIAVAPRRWFEPDMSPASSGGHWEDMADMWAQACDLVVDETGADIIFVPFQRANRNLDDLALCEEIVSKMRRGEKAHVTAHAASFAELLEQVARAQAVAAVRMHGVAAASLCGIPCVALAYDPKVEALMREIRLQEFLVAPDEASAPKVAALLSRAIKESPSLAQGLAAAREALRKRAAAAIKQLAGLLEAR